MSRDDFSKPIKSLVSHRAAFHCSKPDCRRLTLSPSLSGQKSTNIGVVAHISAAAKGGPRYDDSLAPADRKSADNAIFLCASCSVLIDKNGGIDFRASVLADWKHQHHQWVRQKARVVGADGSVNGISIVDLSVHLGSCEYPNVDIKLLNNSDNVFLLTKGVATTVNRYLIPADKSALHKSIAWNYSIDLSSEVGGEVEFEMSQELRPRSAERFALTLRGEFPSAPPLALNLYHVKIDFFQGDSLVVSLPHLLTHIPPGGKRLGLAGLPIFGEDRTAFLNEMGQKSRGVLELIIDSIESAQPICCDYEVVQALAMFSAVDRKRGTTPKPG